MWISALLVGLSALAALAADSCSIDDFSCSINPEDDLCPSPAYSRAARSAKYSPPRHRRSRSYRGSRSHGKRRFTRDVDNDFHYDDEDYADQRVYESSPRVFREVGVFEDPEDPSQTQATPALINDPHLDAYLAHARVCPHCKQSLPAEMFHHPPVDPRVFRQYQQYPHLVPHPYAPPAAHLTEDDDDLPEEIETQLPAPGLYNQSVYPAWPVAMVPPGLMVAPGMVPHPPPPPAAPIVAPPPLMPVAPESPITAESQGSTSP